MRSQHTSHQSPFATTATFLCPQMGVDLLLPVHRDRQVMVTESVFYRFLSGGLETPHPVELRFLVCRACVED